MIVGTAGFEHEWARLKHFENVAGATKSEGLAVVRFLPATHDRTREQTQIL